MPPQNANGNPDGFCRRAKQGTGAAPASGAAGAEYRRFGVGGIPISNQGKQPVQRGTEPAVTHGRFLPAIACFSGLQDGYSVRIWLPNSSNLRWGLPVAQDGRQSAVPAARGSDTASDRRRNTGQKGTCLTLYRGRAYSHKKTGGLPSAGPPAFLWFIFDCASRWHTGRPESESDHR